MKKQILIYVSILLITIVSTAWGWGNAPAKKSLPNDSIVTGYDTFEGVVYLIGNEPFSELILESGLRDGDRKMSIRLVGKNLAQLKKLQNTFTHVEGAVTIKQSRYSNCQINVVKYKLLKGGND